MADLTAEEKRNLELIKDWADAWDKDPERMVDKVYADAPEVFLPLQKIYDSRKGKSKANWRALEVANHKLYKSRTIKFGTLIARGDTVAMEALTKVTDLKDRVFDVWFAAFLKFDKDGRVMSDHTYMLSNPQDPDKVHDPRIKKLLQDLNKTRQKVLADQ